MGLHIRDVEHYRYVAMPWCRSISESSRLDSNIYSQIPVCVEGGSAIRLVADGHALKGAGERVHKGLVLVHLRARSVAQSWMPRIYLRCTQQGHLAARNSSIPNTLFPAVTNSDAGMVLPESTGLALKNAVAPGPDGLRRRALGKPRISFP